MDLAVSSKNSLSDRKSLLHCILLPIAELVHKPIFVFFFPRGVHPKHVDWLHPDWCSCIPASTESKGFKSLLHCLLLHQASKWYKFGTSWWASSSWFIVVFVLYIRISLLLFTHLVTWLKEYVTQKWNRNRDFCTTCGLWNCTFLLRDVSNLQIAGNWARFQICQTQCQRSWKNPYHFLAQNHSSLSLSLEEKCSSPLALVMAICWTLSGTPTSLLYWGNQDWTCYSRHNHTLRWRKMQSKLHRAALPPILTCTHFILKLH